MFVCASNAYLHDISRWFMMMSSSLKQRVWVSGCLLVHLAVLLDAEVSRVCYSTEQNCSTHNLQCSHNRRIGITVARRVNLERSDYTECTCGRYKCDECSGSSTVISKVVSCATPYSTQEYRNLLLDCSFKRNCSSVVPSQERKECFAVDRGSFSEIKFECLSDEQTVDFCNGTGTGTGEGEIKYLSILYRDTSMATRCHCVVKGMDPPSEKYKVKLLDIRNEHTGGGYYTLTFTSDTKISTFGNKTYSQDQRMKMFNGNSSAEVYVNLTVYPGMESPERIWLLIEGSVAVTASCQLDVKASSTTTSSTSLATTPNIKPSTRTSSLPQSTTRSTGTRPQSTTLQHLELGSTSNVGYIASGTVAGIVVVAAIVVVLIILYVKRDKTTKNGKTSKDEYNNPAFSGAVSEFPYTLPDDGTIENLSSNDYNTIADRDNEDEAPYWEIETEDVNPDYLVLEGITNTGYDHLTLSTKNSVADISTDTYNHVTKDAVTSGDYTHIGADQHGGGRLGEDYDTTASAAMQVKGLENTADDYGHLELSTRRAVTGNDYDKLPRM